MSGLPDFLHSLSLARLHAGAFLLFSKRRENQNRIIKKLEMDNAIV